MTTRWTVYDVKTDQALRGQPTSVLVQHARRGEYVRAYDFGGRWCFAEPGEVETLQRQNVAVKLVRLEASK